jgi:hypothetical protein
MRRLAQLERRLLVLGATAFVGFVGAAGCNAILDNQPAMLGSDDRPNEPGDGADAAASYRGPTSQEDGGATSRVVGPSPDAAAADAASTGCAPGSKACGDLCVSPEDPFFGCAGPTCARCDLPNATAGCVAGACAVATCVVGFADCNADPTDGCETDLSAVTSCGACGIVCPARKHAATACVAGACTATCEPGYGDCNGKPQDGCERNLLNDERNCGACGVRCVIGRCDLGTCVWP